MTFSHREIQERMLDYLYGELDVEARNAFQAHLAACEACLGELGALRETRTAVQAATRAALNEPVPAAIHGRLMATVLSAAHARAAETAGGVAGNTAVTAKDAANGASHESTGNASGPSGTKSPVSPSSTGQPAEAPRTRWLDWFRGRWAVPMFATVGALGVLLLGRETIFREAHRPLGDNPVAVTVPESAQQAPARDQAASAQQAHDEKETRGASPGAEPSMPESPPAAPGTQAPTAFDPRPPARYKRARSKERLAEKSSPSSSGAEAETDRAKPALSREDRGASRIDDRAESGNAARRPAAPAGDSINEGGQAAGAAAPAGTADSAPRRTADANAPAQARPSASASPSAITAESTPRPAARVAAGSASRVAAPAAQPSRHPLAKKASAAVEEESSDFAAPPPTRAQGESALALGTAAPAPPPPTSNARTPADAAKPETAVAGQPPTAPILAARAEKLMQAGQWSQAITAYGDLLRRFPKHPQARVWRSQRAAAQSAADRARFATPPPPR